MPIYSVICIWFRLLISLFSSFMISSSNMTSTKLWRQNISPSDQTITQTLCVTRIPQTLSLLPAVIVTKSSASSVSPAIVTKVVIIHVQMSLHCQVSPITIVFFEDIRAKRHVKILSVKFWLPKSYMLSSIIDIVCLGIKMIWHCGLVFSMPYCICYQLFINF